MTTLVAPPAVTLRASAACMLVVEIAIHAYLAPAHLEEIPYIGALFLATSVLLTLALALLFTPRAGNAGWALGSALCVGMALAFVLSRSVGLPNFHEDWTSDSGLGLISLPPELVFVLCAWRGLRRS